MYLHIRSFLYREDVDNDIKREFVLHYMRLAELLGKDPRKARESLDDDVFDKDDSNSDYRVDDTLY